MNTRTRLGLGALGAGLVLGLLGDGLLRRGPWGLNLFVWIALLVLAALGLARWGGVGLKGGGRWLLIPALLFAASFVWRDSLMLKFLSFVALATALGLAAFRAREGGLRVAGILEYALGITVSGIMVFIGIPFLVLNDIVWKEIGSQGRLPRTLAVARGILFSVPLLIIFGSLFMEADAVFERLVREIFFIDFTTLLSHMLLAGFFAWTAAGFLRALLVETKAPVAGLERPTFLAVGIIETGVVLGAVNLLFLSFVFVQFRYLFGGHELVQATTGLTYAQYARRGFFELATVAALVLPLLLGAHWLLRKENPGQERTFRGLAIVQIALVFIIMASAAQRMRLYQSEYGLTELRLYTQAFIGWLAVVFVWFTATVLRGRRNHFVFGAMVAGFLSIGALHLADPDALIVRTNLARVAEGRSFDARYAARRSADAVPTLIAGLPLLSHEDQCTVAGIVLHRWPPPASADWRTWNLARSRAQESVNGSRTALQAVVSNCPRESKPKQD